MEETSTIDILKALGYPIKKVGNNIQSAGIYRGGKDVGTLTIYEDSQKYYDWKIGEGNTLKHLIKITLNLDSESKVDEWLKSKNFEIKIRDNKPKIKSPKIYPAELLKKLIPNHTYWNKRGISSQTMELFRGGLTMERGLLAFRYVLPIFSSIGIIGFCGRAIKEGINPKYLICGAKNEFLWPAFLNHKIIKEKGEVILVESPACVLWLWENGIRNSLCLFGVSISQKVICCLLKMNPRKIIIATNNEQSAVGNNAAIKIESKLLNYFDRENVIIKLPTKKDFAEMSVSELKEWLINHE